MKSTAFALAADNVIVLPQAGFINKWGGLPFLAWIACTGMPMQRSLEVSRPVWTADIYASTLAATSNASTLNSIPFVMFISALYLCAGLMVLGKPKTVFSLLTRQWPLLLLMLFAAASILWSPSREKVLMNSVHNIGTVLIALAAALRYRKTPWLLPKHIGYVLGLNIVVHLAAVAALPSFAIEWDGRWRGLTGQANGLGAIAFCAFWANAAVLIGVRKDRYHLHLLLAASSVAAMLGANSMTSIISSACALALILTFTGPSSRYRSGMRIFIASLGAIALGATVGVLLLGNVMDLGKLLGLAGRSGDFTGRTEIWIEALKAISGRPWLGWGFDDNAFLIKSTGMPYATYHNGYLDLMARGGVISLALLFLLLGKWALEIKRKTLVGSEIIPFAVPFILAMLVYNLTEATLVTPRDQMWLIFLVLIFLGACKKWPSSPPLILRRQRR
jgi:O-antigen ligase